MTVLLLTLRVMGCPVCMQEEEENAEEESKEEEGEGAGVKWFQFFAVLKSFEASTPAKPCFPSRVSTLKKPFECRIS